MTFGSQTPKRAGGEKPVFVLVFFCRKYYSSFSVGLTWLIATRISMKLLYLYLVRHMLHQIKVQQFYTDSLELISPLSQSNISDVDV